MVKGVCRDYASWLEQATLHLEGPVEPLRLADGNPHHYLGQVYDSIRAILHAIPSVPLPNQQDLLDFVAPPEEYIPEPQTNPTIEELQLRSHCSPICHPALTIKISRSL